MKTYSFVLPVRLRKMLQKEADREIRSADQQLEYLLDRHYRRKASGV